MVPRRAEREGYPREVEGLGLSARRVAVDNGTAAGVLPAAIRSWWSHRRCDQCRSGGGSAKAAGNLADIRCRPSGWYEPRGIRADHERAADGFDPASCVVNC
jgi:hypothetical protein